MSKDLPPRQADLESYKLLIQEVKDYAIFMLDVDGTILTWNIGAERLKGYKPQEIIGQHFSRFYSQHDIDSGKPDNELKIAASEGRVEDEGWRLRKDGTRFWANVVITALRDSTGVLRGFAKVTRDMTNRMRAEQELRDARNELERRVMERTLALQKINQDLESADRMKDEFLATLSHELRTPLTAIVGWVQMLRGGNLTEAQSLRALEVIDRNLTVQTQLIDDLLNISRIISGKLKVEPQLVYPTPLVEETIESVRPSIDAKQLHLEIDMDIGLGPLRLDVARFQQIVWNLLTNAVKFTPREGFIRVSLGRVSSQAVLTVGDSGEGIAVDFLPFVFDRFSQADSSRSRKHGGLGLGLSIVRHLVELHGGTVGVESQGPGMGTTFSVTLPIPGVAQFRAISNLKENGKLANLEGLRVLVLEDEVDTREMVVAALQSSGAVVKEAKNVGEALRLLEGMKLDVVVSDIGMPDVDGYAFMRTVRKTNKTFKRIPAVALTAYAGEEHRQASIDAGFDAHISKPVALPELIRTVAALRKRA
jgi:PAS domain S-box-containing protein